MREILFRGKAINADYDYGYYGEDEPRIKNGDWVYGQLIKDNERALIVNGIVETTEEYIWLDNWCPIDHKTIGQYTGLKDKNGVKIFEGDILYCSHTGKHKERGDIIKTEEKYVVEFGVRESVPYELDEFVGWLAVCKWYKRSLSNSLIFRDSTNPYWATVKGDYNLKVIGNIHDNPELLEVE